MHRRRAAAPIACLATVTFMLLPAPALAQQGVAAARVDTIRIDSIFSAWAGDGTPGCAAAVSRSGETSFSRAWGMADLEHGIANTPATIFEAGSVSKQFTAAAIVLLEQQGRLSLDDDVRRYVPELPDYGTPVTIRHLLNHTSGLRDWGSVAAIGGWGRSERTHTHDHVLDILSRQRALNYTPGEQYSYTNSGYNLAAIIVERVSGESFAAFSRRSIFEPLGMNDTQWRDDYRRIVRGRASAYSRRGDAYVIDRPIEHVHGNGGLLTTVADLLTWNEALASGRIGGPALVEAMHRRGVLNDGTGIDYAAGITVGSYRGVREVSHTGATSGYRAVLLRYPDQELGVAVLCNAGDVNPGRAGRGIAALFLADVLAAPEEAAGGTNPRPDDAPTPSAETLAEYVGDYWSPDAEATLVVRVDAGRLLVGRRWTAGEPVRSAGPDEFEAPLGRLRFVRDTSGRVVQLSVSESRVWDLRFDRVP